MFTASTFGLGLRQIDFDIGKAFAVAAPNNTTATATLYKVDMTNSYGVSVSFTGIDLTYGDDKLPDGGTVTGLTIVRKGVTVYSATITGLTGEELGAAALAKSALQLLNGDSHAITARAGGESIFGYALNDRIYGSGSDDKIYGGAGDDSLRGGAGQDLISGGAGNDLIWGGSGYDRLSGGLGSDTFIFRGVSHIGLGATSDRIFDFRHGTDKIDLSAIDADRKTAGNGTFTFIGKAAFTGHAGELHLVAGVLSGDVNGDGIADFDLRIQGSMPTAGDLVL